MTGPGNVIAYNRVSGFRDCISLMEDRGTYEQVSIDIYSSRIMLKRIPTAQLRQELSSVLSSVHLTSPDIWEERIEVLSEEYWTCGCYNALSERIPASRERPTWT